MMLEHIVAFVVGCVLGRVARKFLRGQHRPTIAPATRRQLARAARANRMRIDPPRWIASPRDDFDAEDTR